MQNVAVLFEQAAEQFAAAYPENGPLSPWITEQLGVTEPYLRGKAGVALLLLRLVQRQLTGNSIPLCRDMLPIEDRAAAVPELESVQIWWHRWLGCGIGMGFSGWESLWQAADEALQLLPETLLVTIAQAERSTPFPVMLEAILLYFMYELMREAGLRVPKPLGSSVGIVGGLVIGETAVSAGLVSAPSLVVIAVTVITGYTIPKLYEPMAVLRLTFILVGGIWGVWGVLAGFTFLLFELCGKTSFSVPFLAPVAPFRLSAMRDVLVRAGWKRLVRHNAFVQHMPGAGKGEKHL